MSRFQSLQRRLFRKIRSVLLHVLAVLIFNCLDQDDVGTVLSLESTLWGHWRTIMGEAVSSVFFKTCVFSKSSQTAV